MRLIRGKARPTDVSIAIRHANRMYRFETAIRDVINSRLSYPRQPQTLTAKLLSQLQHQSKRICLPAPRPSSRIQEIETDRLQYQPLNGENSSPIVFQLLGVDRGDVDLGSSLE
jgi:hypothetical protein